MTLIIVPVRYPLSKHSVATLTEAIRVADERDANLTVLHIDLYQSGQRVTRIDLKSAVERWFGLLPHARYVVRSGFLVEETILEEVIAADADLVVIGENQTGRWRRMVRRVLDDPDVERYLQKRLDCQLTIAPTVE